jgi:transporter family-2 protein
MNTTVLYTIWAFAAGVFIPVMASLNGGLARHLGGAPWAAAVLFSVALSVTLASALITRAPLPGATNFAAASPAQLLSGVVIAFYILSITYLAPRLGVARAVMLVVVAQIFTSAAIDHFGLVGAAVRRLTPVKLLGLGVMLTGLAMAQGWLFAKR